MTREDGFVILQRIVNFFHAAIVLLLGTRMILALFNASSTSRFAVWIYNITQSLVSPFVGIIPSIAVGNTGGTIDSAAVIAIAIYSIVAYLIVAFFHSISHPVVTHTHHETI